MFKCTLSVRTFIKHSFSYSPLYIVLLPSLVVKVLANSASHTLDFLVSSYFRTHPQFIDGEPIYRLISFDIWSFDLLWILYINLIISEIVKLSRDTFLTEFCLRPDDRRAASYYFGGQNLKNPHLGCSYL